MAILQCPLPASRLDDIRRKLFRKLMRLLLPLKDGEKLVIIRMQDRGIEIGYEFRPSSIEIDIDTADPCGQWDFDQPYSSAKRFAEIRLVI